MTAIPLTQVAFASTFPATNPPTAPAEPVRHILFGSPAAVRATIKQLHKCNYAEPNDWS